MFSSTRFIQHPFFRFILVGGSINLIAIICFAIGLKFGAEPEFLQIMIAIVAITASHHINRTWTFDYQGNYFVSLLRFATMNIVAILLQLFAMLVFYRLLGFNPLLVQIVAILSTVIITYILSKRIILRS